MKPGQISWRYILWCFGELQEDEWITVKDFIRLFNMPLHSLEHHLTKLRNFCFIRTKYRSRERGSRIQEYQLTETGKKKIISLKKLGSNISWEDNKIKCPQCGFHTSVPELQFMAGLNKNE